MKKYIVLLLTISLAMVWLSGCALYGKKTQYDEGNWYWLTGSAEIARIEQDKLAFKKLKAQPVQTASVDGVIQGYRGLIANLDKYDNVNVHLNGPEKKRYFLKPNDVEYDNLIPGTYTALFYKGENIVGTWQFTVGIEQFSYMGEKVHWYTGYDPY